MNLLQHISFLLTHDVAHQREDDLSCNESAQFHPEQAGLLKVDRKFRDMLTNQISS